MGNNITFEELDSRPVEEGMGRAVIDQGQVSRFSAVLDESVLFFAN